MNDEILPEIRNKLTAPKIALEKLAKGERVPGEFLELAAEELKAAVALLEESTCQALSHGQVEGWGIQKIHRRG